MRKIKKSIDINAHVINLKCHIDTSGGSSLALISFDNLDFGTITAVKFNATGYNSFGDIIRINDNDKFFVVVQDIVIRQNESATDLKAILPDSNIRKLVLEECQICYADGSIVSYSKKDEREFELSEYQDVGSEGKLLKAYRSKFGDCFKYKIADCDVGWVCACGRFNTIDKHICGFCHNSKQDIINATSDEQKETILDEFDKKEEEREQDRMHAEEQKAKLKKQKMKICIGSIIASIIAIVFLGIIINAKMLAGRTIYSSIDAMRSELQGTWTYYNKSSGAGLWQILIDGDTLGQIYKAGASPSYTNYIKWNPSRGTFTVGKKTYIVKKNGDIESDGYTYIRGGSITASFSTSYETVSTALKISNVIVTSNSLYTICTGTITNSGKRSYDYVKVKGAFKDLSGNVIDTDWTYAVGSEGLDPGESTTFRLSVPKNRSITDCTVTFMD